MHQDHKNYGFEIIIKIKKSIKLQKLKIQKSNFIIFILENKIYHIYDYKILILSKVINSYCSWLKVQLNLNIL